MQRQTKKPILFERDDRVLSLGALRVHNVHIKRGQNLNQKCPLCTQGMEGVLAPTQEAKPMGKKPEVASRPGADQEERGTPSYGGRDDTYEDEGLLPGWERK